MQRRKKIALATGTVALAVLAGTAGIVAATGDDNDVPATGDALERASSVALEHTGEGRVTDTEIGDEDSYYEIEVTLDDGSQVDVQLDADFKVVETNPDVEHPDDDD